MTVYQTLAAAGHAVPIGTDLLLHEEADPEAARIDGNRLGEICVRAASHFGSPLAFPLMDLEVERSELLLRGGGALPPEPLSPELRANLDAIRYVRSRGDLVAIGMVIGPLSLAIKVLDDARLTIADAYASHVEKSDAEMAVTQTNLAQLESGLQVSEHVICRSIRMLAEAGAHAICVCEPEASVINITPRMKNPSEVFERLVMMRNRNIRALVQELNLDYILHNCGKLLPFMVTKMAELRPALLSLGSSHNLWETALLIPDSVVLYGNLPSKLFRSDDDMPADKVREMAWHLRREMRQTGHPFILGSECDILYDREHGASVWRKAEIIAESRGPRSIQ